MPIDINHLRGPEKGGDVERWREMTKKRFKPVELVDRVVELDEVRREAAATNAAALWQRAVVRVTQSTRRHIGRASSRWFGP